MKEDFRDVIVIGGGPSGLVASIAARRAGAGVLLLEKNPRVGKKLLTTGNHQCNLTNMDIRAKHYHGDPGFAMRTIARFDRDRTLEFFRALGLETVADESGKVYPRSYQAGSVLDVLRFELDRLRVETLADCAVETLRSGRDGFAVRTKEGRTCSAHRVILCAGGHAAPQTGSTGAGFILAQSLGHTILEPFPALVQLKLDGAVHKAMEGMKWECSVALFADGIAEAQERGDILFTSYGLSGTAALNVSRTAVAALRDGKRVEIKLNLVPEMEEAELGEAIRRRIEIQPERPMEEFFTGWLNKRIGQTLIKALAFDRAAPWRSLSDADVRRLTEALHGWTFTVTGDTGWPNAQTTAGGVDTREVDAETMESRKVPGLFFAGEILNVDGDSGGYNLQWAWSSGFVTGQAAAAV